MSEARADTAVSTPTVVEDFTTWKILEQVLRTNICTILLPLTVETA